jgi:hypothetical protein
MMQAEAPRRIFNASSEANKSLQADFGFRDQRETRSAGALTLQITAIYLVLKQQLKHCYTQIIS